MIPKKEKGTLISSSKRWQGKDKRFTRMPTAEKPVPERKRLYTNACGKERRNRPQMPVAKKEGTDHKWLLQRKKDKTTNDDGTRKMAALIRQANSWHQMKETKQLKPPQNPKRLPTCKHKVEKKKRKKKKTPPNHNSLTDYCLQQRSGRLCTAQSKNNCANDKQMESQTNHN